MVFQDFSWMEWLILWEIRAGDFVYLRLNKNVMLSSFSSFLGYTILVFENCSKPRVFEPAENDENDENDENAEKYRFYFKT